MTSASSLLKQFGHATLGSRVSHFPTPVSGDVLANHAGANGETVSSRVSRATKYPDRFDRELPRCYLEFGRQVMAHVHEALGFGLALKYKDWGIQTSVQGIAIVVGFAIQSAGVIVIP